MEKKYQVFVSSTYEDLREERSKVMSALLELNCIPSGMELFPASDDDAWSLIQRVIDEADYYILIVAGRYGSCDDSGIGYTEKEYRYALSQNKPIIAFLHKSPGQLINANCEQTLEGKKKLEEFRELARRKACKFWTSAGELASVVSRSLVYLIRTKPATGWIRSDKLPADDILSETIRLQKQVRKLEADLKKYQNGPPPGTSVYAQGSDRISIGFVVSLISAGDDALHDVATSIETTWDELLHCLATALLKSPTEREIQNVIIRKFYDLAVSTTPVTDAVGISNMWIAPNTMEAMRIQFLALGIIDLRYLSSKSQYPSPRNKERDFHWQLTSYGKKLIVQMLAICRRDALPTGRQSLPSDT